MLSVHAELTSGPAQLTAKLHSGCATCAWGTGVAMNGWILFGDRSAPQQAAPMGRAGPALESWG